MEENNKCKRCGEPAVLQVKEGFYCSKYCMYKDNPHYVVGKRAQDEMAQMRKQAVVKEKMRALRKEAEEVGLPWN